MKVSLETIQEAACKRIDDPEKVNQLLKDIEQLAAQEAEEEKANRAPTVKKQFVILLSDPNATLPDVEYVGWVAQIPEDDDTALTLERIQRAGYEYNTSKKGRKYPCKTIGEICEAVGPRLMKEQDVAVKTKIPVRVVVTDNRLPEEEGN